MKTTFLDKLISRIERVDPQSLQSFVLKVSREKGFLETLFNTIQEGIVVVDPEGRISYLNAAGSELLGIPAERGVGELISRYLGELDWNKILSADKDEWHKVMTHEIEVSYPRQRFLNFYIVPLVDEQTGLATGMAVILRDVTEARHRAETTVESERLSALTLLAAGVAHEIGNPLNSLNIHIQLMERELKNVPPENAARLREDIRLARDEIARLDRIINQFLHAVRPTSPDLQRVSINQVVTESVELMERELKNRDILVELELAENLPRCLVDPAQLKQAFYNLIRNALQAMRAGGILRVRTEASDDYVSVSFIDTGRGISAEQIGRIFEPYYTTKPEGSGLGLMIVQRIMREHGGTIDVESDTNRGTSVRLKFPISERRTRLLAAAS